MSDEDKTSQNALTLAIRQAVARRSLTREQARSVMEEILSGAAPVYRIGMFLTALRVKGESVEELIGFAQAMRAKAAAVRPRRPVEEDISGTERDALVDTAGTGGDVSGTFNISTATALVFPSFEEAFGMPILEAMSYGVPVITSNSSAMPEIGGDAALYVDPHSVSDISDAMQRVADDDALARELSRRGKQRAGQFRWEDCASQTWNLYQEALQPEPRL